MKNCWKTIFYAQKNCGIKELCHTLYPTPVLLSNILLLPSLNLTDSPPAPVSPVLAWQLPAVSYNNPGAPSAWGKDRRSTFGPVTARESFRSWKYYIHSYQRLGLHCYHDGSGSSRIGRVSQSRPVLMLSVPVFVVCLLIMNDMK